MSHLKINTESKQQRPSQLTTRALSSPYINMKIPHQNPLINPVLNSQYKIMPEGKSSKLPVNYRKQYFNKPELRVIKKLKAKHLQNNTVTSSTTTLTSNFEHYVSLYWEKIRIPNTKSDFFKKSTMFTCTMEQPSRDGFCKCSEPCPWAEKWVKWTQDPNIFLYKTICLQSAKASTIVQIEKDICRTQATHPAFRQQQIKRMLRQILVTYSKYDKKIEYIQGMNLISAVILYHVKNCQSSFWILVDIMEQLEMIELYDERELAARLTLHSQNVDRIIKHKINDLYEHLNAVDVDIGPALYGWFISILCNVVPLEWSHLVLDIFILQGWVGLYKIIICYLVFIKEDLLMEGEASEILIRFSSSYHHGLESGQIPWDEIVASIRNIDISEVELVK